ncbi:MAG: SirB2 family protein [Pseudomonadota bacterium]
MFLYPGIRYLHLVTVAVTAGLFWLRVYRALSGSPGHQARWLRILPHVNDTLLLATGATLVILSGQYPFETPWTTAKLMAVILYILLGMWLLRFARTPVERSLAAWATGLVFVYILSVALTRQPWPVTLTSVW